MELMRLYLPFAENKHIKLRIAVISVEAKAGLYTLPCIGKFEDW
jgi:hypothetical protein